MVSTKFCYNVRDQVQWQPFADVLRNRCSQNVRNIRTITPVLEPLFNKHCYKEIPTQMFSCKYCKIFKSSFFIVQFSLQLISQTPIECIVTGVPFYQLQTCNLQLVKTEGLVQVLCCEFCEISHKNFMQNNFERLPLDVKRCCGK